MHAAPETTVDRSVVESMRWYHTLELPGGVVTPGEFDLRPIIDRLPIPESLAGVRCLDVGGRDGFYSFEMERRGADEVVCIDLGDPSDIHFPATEDVREEAVKDELEAGHRAFKVAREALGSRVQRELISVYRLDPNSLGTFGFAVIGTLLLHLRDPVAALAAVRKVVDGRLLINEAVALGPSVFSRRPLAALRMENGPFWWICNPAGLRRMAEAAGFRVLDSSRPYVIPNGATSHLAMPIRGPLNQLPGRVLRRRGSLHAWVLAEAR